MFRSCQIIIRELCSLLKLYYGYFHYSVQKCIYIKLTNYLHFLLYFLIYIIYNISHIIFF